MHQRPPAVVHVAQEHLPWATLTSRDAGAGADSCRIRQWSPFCSALSCMRRMNIRTPAPSVFRIRGIRGITVYEVQYSAL